MKFYCQNIFSLGEDEIRQTVTIILEETIYYIVDLIVHAAKKIKICKMEVLATAFCEDNLIKYLEVGCKKWLTLQKI